MLSKLALAALLTSGCTEVVNGLPVGDRGSQMGGAARFVEGVCLGVEETIAQEMAGGANVCLDNGICARPRRDVEGFVEIAQLNGGAFGATCRVIRYSGADGSGRINEMKGEMQAYTGRPSTEGSFDGVVCKSSNRSDHTGLIHINELEEGKVCATLNGSERLDSSEGTNYCQEVIDNVSERVRGFCENAEGFMLLSRMLGPLAEDLAAFRSRGGVSGCEMLLDEGRYGWGFLTDQERLSFLAFLSSPDRGGDFVRRRYQFFYSETGFLERIDLTIDGPNLQLRSDFQLVYEESVGDVDPSYHLLVNGEEVARWLIGEAGADICEEVFSGLNQEVTPVANCY